MKHVTTPQFWELYRHLPLEVRELADKNFALLKANPQHPSLHFKKIGRLWSVRVGRPCTSSLLAILQIGEVSTSSSLMRSKVVNQKRDLPPNDREAAYT